MALALLIVVIDFFLYAVIAYRESNSNFNDGTPASTTRAVDQALEQDADGFTFQPVAGTREVQELSDSFGHMVGRIQRLMNTVREEEIVLRKQNSRRCRRRSTPISCSTPSTALSR